MNEDLKRELRELYSTIPETAAEQRLMEIRRAELLRRLHGVSDTSVRCDRIFGARPEPPDYSQVDDEEWRADPMLRHMRESGEDWR